MTTFKAIPIEVAIPEQDYPLPGSVPTPTYSTEERESLRDQIKALLKAQDAVLVAHYYTDEAIQALAEETGGYVSDSLDMARFGHAHSGR